MTPNLDGVDVFLGTEGVVMTRAEGEGRGGADGVGKTGDSW